MNPDGDLGELPPQKLARGQCALVLWSKELRARRIVMALNAPALARIQVGGRTLELPRTALDGPEVFGHPARQTFAAAGRTLTLEIEVAEGRDLPGGVVVTGGAVDYRDPSGWSTLIPVGGLIACDTGP